ncbi:MAG: hypothetical protein IPP72_00030 [Chitinophagaceae bacterium]|nr:hypothetical protein [Chitinophagaceae bacterium]
MNSLIVTIIFVLNFSKTQIQEPPPYFKFDFRKLSPNKDSLLKQYEFTTFGFADSLLFEQYNRTAWGKERLLKNINDTVAYVYIDPREMLYKGSVVRLSIEDKKANKKMDICIRICFMLGYNDQINITGLSFMPGIFFYDMCNANTRYTIPCQKKDKPYLVENELAMGKIKKHSVTISKLSESISKTKCE